MKIKNVKRDDFVVKKEIECYNTLQYYRFVADVVVKKFAHIIMQLRNVLCSSIVVENVVVVAVVLK